MLWCWPTSNAVQRLGPLTIYASQVQINFKCNCLLTQHFVGHNKLHTCCYTDCACHETQPTEALEQHCMFVAAAFIYHDYCKSRQAPAVTR